MTESCLRLDAVCMIKTVLASTATKDFTDVMGATFGGTAKPAHMEEEDDNDDDEDYEPEEQDIEETGDEPSTSSAATTRSQKHLSATPTTVPKKKQAIKKPSSHEVCKLKDASPIYLTVSDSKAYLHSCVEDRFLSSRMSSSVSKDAQYACKYSEEMKKDGKIVLACEFISTTKGQLSTHVRQMHLGSTVTCYMCQKKSWSMVTWFDHMQEVHKDLQKQDYYIQEGTDIESFKVKVEVDPDDI